MLCGKGESTTQVYNGLKDHFKISKVILEDRVDRKKFLQRRAKRMGYLKVFGQILFQLIIPKIQGVLSSGRINQIKSEYNLVDTAIPDSQIKYVSSVNSKDCIQYLKEEKPDVIIVNGTRIIGKKVLNAIDGVFINTHAGITPKYRGVHGGYWAMANKDKEHFGVTVHLVNAGIDTGGILSQSIIQPGKKDNFLTYTYLQVGEGINLMRQALEDCQNDEVNEIEPPTTESNLFYHPTLWYYLYHRIFHGVK